MQCNVVTNPMSKPFLKVQLMKNKTALLVCSVWLCAALIVRGDDEDKHDQNLPNANFAQKSLNRANFSDAILDDANFHKASLKKANFKGASIKSTSFYEADLTEADLRDTEGQAFFSDANLTKANLEGVSLVLQTRTNMRGANLKKSKISGVFGNCDFSGADLRGANLRAAKLSQNLRWKGAFYDEDTAFPEGFDPVANGMVLGKPEPPTKPDPTVKPESKNEAKPEPKVKK